jgi:hypothetical protein
VNGEGLGISVKKEIFQYPSFSPLEESLQKTDIRTLYFKNTNINPIHLRNKTIKKPLIQPGH